MKTFKIALLSFLFLFILQTGFAQVKTEKYTVAGECGTCKKKIESAAKKGGATYAFWDEKTKELTVKYNSTSSNAAKIQQTIAGVGYDTPAYKATDAAYNKLDDCCKYDRVAATATTCCGTEACAKEACFKDGKCTKDAACCKDGVCEKNDCCTKS